MALLNDLISYGTAQNLVTAGQVFKDFVPDKPDSIVAFLEYAGGPTPMHVRNIKRRSIQVLVRETTVTAASTKIWQLYNALTPGSDDYTLELVTDNSVQIHLRDSPFKLKKDSQERTYFVFNMGVLAKND